MSLRSSKSGYKYNHDLHKPKLKRFVADSNSG